MVGGYMGKLLRINLTKEQVKEEKLPDESVLRKYLGCLGLGLKIYFDEVPPSILHFDPKNLLIFMTGPLTGTVAPGSSNYAVVTLNAESGYTVGVAHSHGVWGPNLRFAGYDGIIFEGAADRPVYLWIHDGGVEIRDAAKMWGKDTYETEDLVKEDVGKPTEEVSVAAIGPAGENLCHHGAMIVNDRNSSASRCGVGAVMGSKKLKAVAVYARKHGVPVADKKKALEAAKEWRKENWEGPFGVFISTANKLGNRRPAWYLQPWSLFREPLLQSAVKNFTTCIFPEWYSEMDKAARTFKVQLTPCWNCHLSCRFKAEITSGPYTGKVVYMGGGGENMEGCGSNVGLSEAGAVYMTTKLLDRMGLEGVAAGSPIALAIECYEKGLITKEDTGGLELRWGDAELVMRLIEMIAKKEGFGRLLALGPQGLAEHIGGDAPKFAVHVKGAAIHIHDWRSGIGTLFGYAVSGACKHEGLGADIFGPFPTLGLEKQDPSTPEGKPDATRKTQVAKLFYDSTGCCWFCQWHGVRIETIAKEVSGVTGWMFTREEALTLGERIANLERIFNITRGLKAEDDLDMSPRLQEPCPDGWAKGRGIGPYLEKMVREYYRLMGWDEETGIPSDETLKRLGLEEYIDTVKKTYPKVAISY